MLSRQVMTLQHVAAAAAVGTADFGQTVLVHRVLLHTLWLERQPEWCTGILSLPAPRQSSLERSRERGRWLLRGRSAQIRRVASTRGHLRARR